MKVGQLDIVDGAACGPAPSAGVTDTSGDVRVIEATADPGAVRTVRAPEVAPDRRRRSPRNERKRYGQVVKLLKNAHQVIATSRHICQTPQPTRAKTELVPLFPPINQWGRLRYRSTR